MSILDEPTPPKLNSGGRYVVGLIYDAMNSNIELQCLRDLMLLGNQYQIAVNDLGRQITPALFEEAEIETSDEVPVLNLVYKTIEEWPYYDMEVPTVLRDMQVKDESPKLDTSPHPGYYLRDQGRDGANLTEMYLNRTAPRGNGVSDAFVVLLWGN